MARCSRFDVAALLLLACVGVLAALTVRHYAVSNDEEVQHRYGELIINFYTSGFADRAVFEYKNLYLYGGLFDVLAVLLAKALPFDPYLIRHALCAAIGIGGMGGTWATARLVAGPRAGFIALCMIAATSIWFGAMFNHTKDIPFAAAMIGATFFLLRIGRDLPCPRWRDTLGFGVMLGAACGLRAMGMLLVGYLGLIALVRLAPMLRTGGAVAFTARSTLRLLPAVLVGYAIMLAGWPYAWQDLLNPIRALFEFAHFHYLIHTILAGTVYEMGEVPRWYVPAYLVIRLPLIVLTGALAAGVLALGRHGLGPTNMRRTRAEVGLLWFTVLFPIACHVIGHGPGFTGMRHFFFVVPTLSVLAGIGADATLEWLAERQRVLGLAAAAALAAALVWEASLMVRLHPYQYLYYNALVGGLPGAAGRYEMDYWVGVMPEAVERLQTHLEHEGAAASERRYTVGVCGERASFENAASRRLEWSRFWYEADFFIAPTQMGCDRVNNGDPVIKIERLGVLIGVVKDRRRFPSPLVSGAP
jgi:hypothetical protein